MSAFKYPWSDILISKSQQTRLKYEVRISTDYFINDLLKNVFLSNNCKDIKNIKKANWYRKNYENDPSVNSMIEAVKSVHSIIGKTDAALLAEFILKSIGFVCINLKSNDNLEDDTYTKVREYGEKMYEIVNTSGDPMEPNEHEKVHLLSDLADNEKETWTEKWEMWQDFFWQHKADNHESADEGFNEFLDWVETIIGKKEKLKSLEKLIEIEKYFKALFLWSNIQFDLTSLRDAKVFDINEKIHLKEPSKLVVIFPMLQYLKDTDSVTYKAAGYSIHRESVNLESIFRFVRFFTNISKNTEAAGIALSIAKELKPNDDITKIHRLQKSQYDSILTDEENFKLSLYEQSDNSKRHLLEDTFWQAEDNDYLYGKIDPVFKWMNIKYNRKGIERFSIDLFQDILETFTSLFIDEEKLEIVRLCMLSLNNNWDVFLEGWSRGVPRYYMGSKNDIKDWRKKITLSIFKDIIINEFQGKLTNKFINENIMRLEDVKYRKIIRKLRSEAPDHWQWRNNKRFFVVDDGIYFPNGTRAGEYTSEKVLL